MINCKLLLYFCYSNEIVFFDPQFPVVSPGKMGCTRSKIAATVAPEDGTRDDSRLSCPGPAQEAPEITTSASANGHWNDNKNKDITLSKPKKRNNKSANKRNKAPLAPINHRDLLPDIDIFSSYDSETADLAVNNAKPRLNCPGIGRAVRLAPIVPGVETQNNTATGTCPTLYKSNDGTSQSLHLNGLNLSVTDHSITDFSSGRSSLPNSDLGFYHNRPPPTSVSPRNSISRTTMKTGITPDSSGIFSSFAGSEFSPLNTSRSSFQPASRASSARTGSVLTTSALNTSFMTSVDGDDDSTHETTMENCPLDTTDAGSEADAYSRAASTTPMQRIPGDAFNGLPPDVAGIGTIVEEYEGGFTPRGLSKDVSAADLKPTPESKLPHFTPKEIYEHNDRMGTIDWCMYLGKVYDITRLKNNFEPLINEIKQSRDRQFHHKQLKKDREYDKDSDSDSISDSDDESNEFNSRTSDSMSWNRHSVYNILRAGIDKATLKQLLGACCVGCVVQPDEGRYWEDIRSDVRRVLDDLIRADVKDTLSEYSADYMHLLQRWIAKYRQTSPNPPLLPRDKDLNKKEYPLPEEIARTPEVLRDWLETWVRFDLELPDNGAAWDLSETTVEAEDEEADPHTIFLSSLRPYLQDLPALDLAITGEAGWRTIPQNLFADDVMTDKQLQTENSRRFRTDLHNPERMRKRRSRLLQYFVKTYDMDRSKVAHFENWADEMQKSQEQFLRLCH
ncbi:hypothetical protein PoB_006175500 [Plakobranchus ocellatus]|uniref:Cytochrome b5 heme-binding domain-containing protein n=1 Tax=Plakobranchus ocellatus TaxID=259542 RepID=A0AAV4CTL7_9GAST|nr:hypothetical protein PoB_006175500 [Plakobranchus ocellatus]